MSRLERLSDGSLTTSRTLSNSLLDGLSVQAFKLHLDFLFADAYFSACKQLEHRADVNYSLRARGSKITAVAKYTRSGSWQEYQQAE